MHTPIRSIILHGSSGSAVDVECQLSNSLPSIVIVGLGNKAVDEAKDRIRGAFASSNLPLPRKRITINLAPADLPKDSTSLDLAIAAAIIMSSQAKPVSHNDMAFVGEVGLGGAVRPVRGIIGMLLAGKKLGIKTFILPVGNLVQAQLVDGLQLIPVVSIADLYAGLSGDVPFEPQQSQPTLQNSHSTKSEHTLSAIAGQHIAKRALMVAAAGGHNILLSGPPGSGKSMLAKALPSLLPPLTHDEMLEATHIYSIVSNTYDELITTRPLRAPHHSASHAAVVGGGAKGRPGELSLSHRGVLLLDEMPEFNRAVLEALRQPLEDKTVTIARARHTVEYPADFILAATANPCPCGYYGSERDCRCTAAQLQRYQLKLSGPILDRIDLFIQVSNVKHAAILAKEPSPAEDARLAALVAKARQTQYERLGEARLNSGMSTAMIREYAHLSPSATQLLNMAAERLQLSARGYVRLVKVARTIADLEQCATIAKEHISEALQYRQTGHNQ